MVIGPAVVMRMHFHHAFGLQGGEARKHQQNQKGAAREFPAISAEFGWAAEKHPDDFDYTPWRDFTA